MYCRRLACLFLFGVIVLLPLSGFAQLQRMAILSGGYKLPPNSSKSVNAYCMDYTRHAPEKGSQYQYLLTSPENATVTIGTSEQLSLQEAIDRKKVSIEGINMTVGQLLNSLSDPMVLNRIPEADRSQILQMKETWNSLTPAQRATLERELAPDLAKSGGDFTHLKLVNHTSQPISISLSRDAVFGAERESVPLFDTQDVGGRGGTNTQGIQSQFWRAATKKHQAMLQDIGYYKGPLSGEVDPNTKNAIVKFKTDHRLPSDSVIDSQTENALMRASQDSRNAKYIAFTLETGGDGPLYRLYSPGGEQVYSGNLIPDLLTAINTERDRKGRGNNVYLIMKGFADKQVNAFAASTRIYQNSVDPTVSIRPFESGSEFSKAEDFFFSPGKTLIEESVTEPVLVMQGANKDFYQSDFKVADAAGDSGTVSVFARAREVVVSFVQGVRSLFQRRQENWSVSKIVNVARSQMKRKYDVSDENLRVQFRDQFGRSHIVELRVVSARTQNNSE